MTLLAAAVTSGSGRGRPAMYGGVEAAGARRRRAARRRGSGSAAPGSGPGDGSDGVGSRGSSVTGR